jgi:AraC-like DNA-binding protein
VVQKNPEVLDRTIVVCQLIYAALKLPSFMLDLSGNRIIQIPEKLVDNCFCTRLSRAEGTEVDLDHAYQRFRDACVLDTNLTHYCPYGMSAITVPVKAKDKVIAVVSFGPILTNDPLKILEEQTASRPSITDHQKVALAEYLSSLTSYDTGFLNAFSQIISLALNKDAELSVASRAPMSETDFRAGELKNYSCPEIVEAAMHYIAENFTNDISLTDVAEHVFVHPTHLSKLFNQYTSFSFRDYLNHLRISKARLLLLSPNKTVASVCFDVGFSDQSYFIRVFKAIEGITPGQFREQNLPKNHKSIIMVRKKEAPDKYRHLLGQTLMQKQ